MISQRNSDPVIHRWLSFTCSYSPEDGRPRFSFLFRCLKISWHVFGLPDSLLYVTILFYDCALAQAAYARTYLFFFWLANPKCRWGEASRLEMHGAACGF